MKILVRLRSSGRVESIKWPGAILVHQQVITHTNNTNTITMKFVIALAALFAVACKCHVLYELSRT